MKTVLNAVKTQKETISLLESRSRFAGEMCRNFIIWLWGMVITDLEFK